MIQIIQVRPTSVTDGLISRLTNYHHQYNNGPVLNINTPDVDYGHAPKYFINNLLIKQWNPVSLITKQVTQHIDGNVSNIVSLFTDSFGSKLAILVIDDVSKPEVKPDIYVGYVRCDDQVKHMFSQLKLYADMWRFL